MNSVLGIKKANRLIWNDERVCTGKRAFECSDIQRWLPVFDIYLELRNSIVTHSCQRCSMGAELATWCVFRRWGPDVVAVPWGNKLYHSHCRWWEKGGEEGRRERVRGKQRQTGSKDLTTQCSQSFLQAQTDKNNTLFKAVFSTPNVSRSLKPHLLMPVGLFCHTAGIMGGRCSWFWVLELKKHRKLFCLRYKDCCMIKI